MKITILTLFGNRGRVCMGMAMIGLGLSLSPTSLFGQCPTVTMQNEHGSATRSKVGQTCLTGDCCPQHYYFVDKTIRTWVSLSPFCPAGCSNLITYYSTNVVSYSLPSGDPANDYCGSSGPISTYFYGQFVDETIGSCPPGSGWQFIATRDPANNYWYYGPNPWDISYCDPWHYWEADCENNWGLDSYFLGASSGVTCDSAWSSVNGYNYYGYAVYTGLIQRTLIGEFNTSLLTNIVIGYAQARMTTTFANGDPVASSKMDKEYCAAAARSNWRIEINATNPKLTYQITWLVKTNITTWDDEGVPKTTSSSALMPPQKVKGQAGMWHYPSDAGASVPPPAFPTGCLNQLISITYTSPTITLAQ